MEIETKLENPKQENKKTKLIIYLLLFLTVIFIVGLAIAYLILYKPNEGQPNLGFSSESENQSDESSAGSYGLSLVTNPNIQNNAPVIGRIKTIEGGKLKIDALDFTGGQKNEIEKEIIKSEVSAIKKLIKNPNFNENKVKQIQEEMKKKYEENKKAVSDVSDESMQLMNDPSLRPYVEKDISWEELKTGEQISWQKDFNNGENAEKKILVVLSEMSENNTFQANSAGENIQN